MKERMLFYCFSMFSLCCFAQQSPSTTEKDGWGDYYFLNQQYAQAAQHFSADSSALSIQQKRNYAKALLAIGKENKATAVYTEVVNSVLAEVEDYYRYASLIPQQKALAKEYRDKAYRLSWPTPSLFENDSLLYKKRFSISDYRVNPLEGSTEQNEYGLIFISNSTQNKLLFLAEQEFKWNKKRRSKLQSAYPVYDFYEVTQTDAKPSLVNRKVLPQTVNSLFQEGPGSYSPTDGYLYFTRSSQKLDKNRVAQLGIYRTPYAKRNSSVLAEALPINSPAYSLMHPSVSKDGKTLYFASDMPGGFGGMDLYAVQILPQGFSQPKNLGPDVNGKGDEVFPFVYNSDFIFFSSNSKSEKGAMDVYLAEHIVEQRWETFLLGDSINGTKDDFSFGISPDDSTAFFSSNRKANADDDVFYFPFKPKMMGLEDHFIYVPSDTLVVANRSVLSNDEQWMEDKDPLQRLLEKTAVLISKPKNGRVIFNGNGSFIYKNTVPEKQKDSFSYTIKSRKGLSSPIWVQLQRAKVEMAQMDTAIAQTFSPIFYAYNKSSILSDYQQRVDLVVAAMQNNPTMEIEVRSYTDCKGSPEYNLELSKRRTQAILDYVKAKIENPQRIFGDGYGVYQNSGFELMAGAFSQKANAENAMAKLINEFPAAKLKQVNGLYRIVAATPATRAAAKLLLAKLNAMGISAWVSPIDCEAQTEEAGLGSRKTEFTVIRL